MNKLKKNIIIIILFILFIIFIQYQVKAAADYSGEHFYSTWINGNAYKCQNWYCIESNQHIERYIRGGVYGEWTVVKTVDIDTTKDTDDLWHILGAIAIEGKGKGTFDWGHSPGNHQPGDGIITNRGKQLQAYVWQLIAEDENEIFKNKIGFQPICSICRLCKSLDDKIGTSDKTARQDYLGNGKNYKYKIYVWKRTFPTSQTAQRLIYIGTPTEDDDKPQVNLSFYKITSDGNTGISGAELEVTKVSGLEENTGLDSITKTSAGTDGKFGDIIFYPTSNSGSFKVKLNETPPTNYLGIPNDTILTVTYNKEGSVTRTKGRNIK